MKSAGENMVSSGIKVEENLKEALDRQEEVLSFIYHELKTPLTVTCTAVQALKLLCGGELSEKANEYVQRIHQSSLQQLRLVNNLLEITRADAGYLKINKRNSDIVSQTKTIIDSVSLFARQKGVSIKFASSDAEIVTAIDEDKYERILLNLLSNAIKFTPEGKSIYVNAYKDKGMVCIEVRDEGVGIPKEKHEIIFKRFGQVGSSLTRKSEGTGIGLYLVKLLVEALEGDIKLESSEGLGSTFTVCLPLRIEDGENEEKTIKAAYEDHLSQAARIEFSNID